jgi:hypothetical protein
MKILKRIAIGVVVVYVLIVVVFESTLGYSQPQFDETIVLTTIDGDEETDRVVTRIVADDKLYVRVNHWPRAWFWRVQDSPDIKVTIDGETGPYRVVEVSGEEFDRVNAAQPRGIGFRILTGFPPTSIIRLDPTASLPSSVE